MSEQIKTEHELLSAIYEHNLAVEKKLDTIEHTTKANEDQLNILAKDSREFSKEIIRLDVFQKFHKQEFDEHIREQAREKNELHDNVRKISGETFDSRILAVENKIQKLFLYIMTAVFVSTGMGFIKDGLPYLEKIIKTIFGAI